MSSEFTEHHVTVYGRNWCEDTQATRKQLDGLGVPYQYIDIEQNAEAAAWVEIQNGGKRRTPTLDIDGTILVEPDEQELKDSLRQAAVIA